MISALIAQGGNNMFNMDKIMSLNADEILIANGLQAVAAEAKEHSELIHNAYHCFGIGEDKIEVWHDRDFNNFEYLTHNGVWQARYLHQSYDVSVDADTIFDYYRAEWLVENGYVAESENGYYTEYCIKKHICGYFRSFVRRIPNPENS